MVHPLLLIVTLLVLASACSSESDKEISNTHFSGAEGEIKLVTLNPGHFHAGLVHKYGYAQVDPTIYIYAPDGKELESHLGLIDRYNNRAEDPTQWTPTIYRGDDYLEKMLEEKPGNVLVLSGSNSRKISYIESAVNNGIHVLADKPMVIYPKDFETLRTSLETAKAKGLLVNDIMTERHEITSILQREFSQVPEIFGELVDGSPDEPAITKESVHYFSKVVSGRPLIRPAWFFDVSQQGEAIVDVSTHLTDLILWQAFPDEAIDYLNPAENVAVLSAQAWPTSMTIEQFQKVTNQASFPAYLEKYLSEDGTLQVNANGEFVFKVRGIHGKVSVKWGFENPTGGDTHFSRMKGTKSDLVIRQDAPQNYKATLYIEPNGDYNQEALGQLINSTLADLSNRYPGLSADPTQQGWVINVPDAIREGHEEHFTRVTEDYLQYLIDGALPEWELQNLLTKYFITTNAYALSR